MIPKRIVRESEVGGVMRRFEFKSRIGQEKNETGETGEWDRCYGETHECH